MKGFIKTITLCLLLVCLALSTVACSSSDNDIPAPYGANLGKVSEEKWISALTIPEGIENFSLLTIEQEGGMTQSRTFAISSTGSYSNGFYETYYEGQFLKVTIVSALVNIQGINYAYEKAYEPSHGNHYDIRENDVNFLEEYLERINSFVSRHVNSYSSFTYDNQEEAFVLKESLSFIASSEFQIKIFENGFSYKEVTTYETSTDVLDFVFYNVNSTTVDVPQYIIDDINTWIQNPEAFN